MRNIGNRITYHEEKISNSSEILDSAEFIICYGFSYLIDREVINRFNGKIINLHISYLPWNRGSDPNFWSILDAAPKGVSIHLINEGVDKGLLLAQRKVGFCQDDTLRTSYERLKQAIEELFMEE